MYIEQFINPVSPVFLRSDSTQFNQSKETFHDIFQRTLNHNSGSRPPKIELTGILVPIAKLAPKPQSDFKLETDQNDYVLRMSDAVSILAKKLEWEEVTVMGYHDADEGIFEVEKISLSNRSEPYRLSLGPTDLFFELDQYKKSIVRKGMLDIAPDIPF
jgi:hypothetical protein